MSWRLTFACVLVATFTIVPAIIEGIYSNRWGIRPDMSAAAEQLEHFPKEFGPWSYVREGDPVSDAVSRALSLAGYVWRELHQP